jgi:hypothetical protein
MASAHGDAALAEHYLGRCRQVIGSLADSLADEDLRRNSFVRSDPSRVQPPLAATGAPGSGRSARRACQRQGQHPGGDHRESPEPIHVEPCLTSRPTPSFANYPAAAVTSYLRQYQREQPSRQLSKPCPAWQLVPGLRHTRNAAAPSACSMTGGHEEGPHRESAHPARMPPVK